MEKLHPKAVWLFFWQYFFVGLFLTLVFLCYIIPGVLSIFKGTSAVPIFFIVLLVLAIFHMILCYSLARLSYRYWRYELADSVLKIEKGIIWKKYISIPYERIQNIDIYRGVLARLLGLSDLHLQTAGYSGQQRRTEGRLPGLDPQIAEQLREQLVQKVKSTKQGL